MICALLRHYVLFFLWGKRERLMTTGGWGRSGCLILIFRFPQTSHIISGSFAERDLQVRASNACWPPYTCSNPIWLEHVIAGAMQCVTPLIHMCDMTRSYVWPASFIRVTWLIQMRDTTLSYVWHDFIHYVGVAMKAATSCILCRNCLHPLPLRNDSCIRMPWLIHMCDMTNSYVCHDLTHYVSGLRMPQLRTSFAPVTWLIHTYAVTHLYV